MAEFKLNKEFNPAGDQPQAIERLVQGLRTGKKFQTLMGVTGSVETVIKRLLGGTLEGGESLCKPGAGKGYGVEKDECDHPD